MNSELRKEYMRLDGILKELYSMYDEAIDNGTSEKGIGYIKDALKEVRGEQNKVVKKIRENLYKKFTKKEINEYSKAERKRRKEQLEKEKFEKEQERIKQEEKDAKIVFNGQYYILMYCDGEKAVSKLLDRQLLDKNIDFAYDYNICSLLKDIDDEKGTGLYRKYRYGLLPVVYDFSNTKRIDRKAIKQLKKISKETSEKNENISVVGLKKRTLKGVLAGTAVAAMVGLSALGITNIFKKSNKSPATRSTYSVSNEIDNSIEVPKEESTIKISKDTVVVEDTNKTIDNVQDNVKNKVKNEKEIVNDTEEIIVKTQENVKVKVSEIKEKEEGNEFNGLSIGSTVKLPDMDLYYSSTADEAVGNTKYLSAPTGIYRVDLISIVYKGRCLEVMSNEGDNLDTLKKYVKEKYGDDIKISVNLDVVDKNNNTVYKNVGWVDSEILYKKSKVMIK